MVIPEKDFEEGPGGEESGGGGQGLYKVGTLAIKLK